MEPEEIRAHVNGSRIDQQIDRMETAELDTYAYHQLIFSKVTNSMKKRKHF